jgi:hypothetical protein
MSRTVHGAAAVGRSHSSSVRPRRSRRSLARLRSKWSRTSILSPNVAVPIMAAISPSRPRSRPPRDEVAIVVDLAMHHEEILLQLGDPALHRLGLLFEQG